MSIGVGEDSSAMIRRLWPTTRRGWVIFALVLFTFFVLDVLALLGSRLATELLISLSGMLAGMAAAYAATRPFKSKLRDSGVWRLLGLFVGLAMVFGILLAGSALADIPLFPTAEGGYVGDLIYGLAFGFGIGLPRGLGFPLGSATPDDQPWLNKSELKVLAVVVGAVVALFTLAFAAYIVFEYVVGPLVRYLA